MSNVNTKVNNCYNYVLNNVVKAVRDDQQAVKRPETIIKDFKLSEVEIENQDVPL